MNRRFALAAVARVRRIQTDLATVALAHAHADERAAEEARTVAVEAYRRARTRPATADEVPAFLALVEGRLRHAGTVERSALEVGDAQERTAAAVGGWQAARTRRMAMEQLEAAHAAALRTADQAAEQRAADDRAGARAARMQGVVGT